MQRVPKGHPHSHTRWGDSLLTEIFEKVTIYPKHRPTMWGGAWGFIGLSQFLQQLEGRALVEKKTPVWSLFCRGAGI
jgi:hypothetical protein